MYSLTHPPVVKAFPVLFVFLASAVHTQVAASTVSGSVYLGYLF